MRFGKSQLVGLALGGLLLLGAGMRAHADFPTTFTTIGTFTGGTTSGTGTYTDDAGAVVVTYSAPTVNSVDAETQASFGTFTTSSTTATTAFTIPAGVTFTLEIDQTAPTAEPPLFFTGTLSGSLRGGADGGSSTAFVQFNGPLRQFTASGNRDYEIVSSDNGTPGRVNLSAPGAGNPPGTTTINGFVSVPEPTSLVLMGLGAPMLLGLARLRRKGRATA